ncbi:hypothetical protein B0T26DRAFT_181587 [Lasiosphaeria miniovina]|uniref:Uncharacterized protein n=1 Tax=Lasiosphaeria miniovina TaxID=1954250 RepID=A0AA40B6N7_9PEZI|nr:uncharacterized protein B0T26DRAFT_181587 [Lasiosphaeria miniovina]KAK0728671.1 hypothetical protein B0T26DRAFT_181587 [Lasiosphaeria miniovina]
MPDIRGDARCLPEMLPWLVLFALLTMESMLVLPRRRQWYSRCQVALGVKFAYSLVFLRLCMPFSCHLQMPTCPPFCHNHFAPSCYPVSCRPSCCRQLLSNRHSHPISVVSSKSIQGQRAVSRAEAVQTPCRSKSKMDYKHVR